ncbi:hypothetical protein KAFR_0L00350 [Kazachstania africana CBS 2517]|uniref:Uncharacterized protein n=1 Tax=Kazachstania africana (strain ATCC 22294 / BCRC 22015 / CBS 2517 / CECT 1963 / NBRC 1671 / NRRL Y-8276) TaxID=1071382 RepID=H2B1Z2_KAZAF|nr:hypothetical protein KAFR_0L00350 [Kazachstania africana CBS 2517]CCF60642.1 hypothetical protein KAFR_0L00350 [Kazachstania africana CBS 2517]
MAPMIRVMDGDAAEREVKGAEGCQLYSLVQYNCEYRVGGTLECFPFKRMFLECLDKSGKLKRVETRSGSCK